LYAKWTIDESEYWTVTFVSNGGSSVAAEKIFKAYPYITEPADPTRTNWEFAGWFEDDGTFLNEWDFATAISGTKTLYAKWVEVPGTDYWTVTFVSNGGSAIPSQSVANGDLADEPANPSRKYWEFAGWYSDAALTVPFNFDTPITEDTIIYAKWNEILFTVTVAAENGTSFKYYFDGVLKGSFTIGPSGEYKIFNVSGGTIIKIEAVSDEGHTVEWKYGAPGHEIRAPSGSVFSHTVGGDVRVTVTLTPAEDPEEGFLWGILAALLITLLIYLALLRAGGKAVTGTVAHNGSGLKGARVEYTVNGTEKQAVTDTSGGYIIKEPEGSLITITGVTKDGHAVSEKLPVSFIMEKGKTDINFEL
jgi:uncharacterized repeat protein (TIGR02543 family)